MRFAPLQKVKVKQKEPGSSYSQALPLQNVRDPVDYLEATKQGAWTPQREGMEPGSTFGLKAGGG